MTPPELHLEPTMTKATPRIPDTDAGPDEVMSGDCAARNCTNSPKRDTTKPSAMIVSPVRSHARSVRSAAKKTRGSDCEIGIGVRGLTFELTGGRRAQPAGGPVD